MRQCPENAGWRHNRAVQKVGGLVLLSWLPRKMASHTKAKTLQVLPDVQKGALSVALRVM